MMQLTTLKHAIMRLDALYSDLREIAEDDITDEEKAVIEAVSENAADMEVALIQLVKNHMDPDDFMNETITAPDLDDYPE